MVTPSNLKECTCSTILLLKDKSSKGDPASLVTMAISFVFDQFIKFLQDQLITSFMIDDILLEPSFGMISVKVV